MTFSYTSAPIASAMLERAQAGLLVQGVFERQNAAGTGAVFGRLKAGGIDILTDGNCYILHHKVILIDDHIVIRIVQLYQERRARQRREPGDRGRPGAGARLS